MALCPVSCDRGADMNDQKNTPPKRAGVSRKIPRQERAARASVFTYAHGKETISTMRPKPAAVANLADLKVRELVQWRKERLAGTIQLEPGQRRPGR